MSLDRALQRVWYRRAPWPLFALLAPLSWVFAFLSSVRRTAYGAGLLRAVRVERPVVVVGNITVGGTGKTPLVIWMTEYLQSRGYQVGIVTRGYGGRGRAWPQDVTSQSASEEVGDEALLLALRTGAIVVADPDRVAAARRAVERGAQIILSDDGLQHYRLARDREIVVLDGRRGLGNGWRLPAGPLRESAARLGSVDLVVVTQRSSAGTDDLAHPMPLICGIVARHELGHAVNLATGEQRSIDSFVGRRVHAIAAIGHPEAFFDMLRARGLDVDARALPDHAAPSVEALRFPDAAPVLMTEKDAVKCRAIADERHWAVRLNVRFEDDDERRLRALLDGAVGPAASPTIARGEP